MSEGRAKEEPGAEEPDGDPKPGRDTTRETSLFLKAEEFQRNAVILTGKKLRI